MALSTTISLPRSHSARFPDRCVVCDCESPYSHVRIMTGTLGWWTWLMWWWGKSFVAKAPACALCAWKLHGRRSLSLVVTIAITAAALWFIWPILKDSVPGTLRKWVAMGFAIVCLLPQFILEAFFAKPFDVTAYSDSVDYEFTSKDYAIDFGTLNIDAAWVKVNGENVEAE